MKKLIFGIYLVKYSSSTKTIYLIFYHISCIAHFFTNKDGAMFTTLWNHGWETALLQIITFYFSTGMAGGIMSRLSFCLSHSCEPWSEEVVRCGCSSATPGHAVTLLDLHFFLHFIIYMY